MKKIMKYAAAAALLIGGAACVASCGKQKPASAADTAAVDQMVEEVVAAQDSTSSNMGAYDAAFFKAGEGVTKTPSGLAYVVVKEGTGAAPSASDMVTVHYTGRLLDGTVFDSSIERGEPTTFPLKAVIPGWTEGLQLMKEGGKTVFYIPSDLAYGEMGTPGGPIGPNSDLIFEVELIKVN